MEFWAGAHRALQPRVHSIGPLRCLNRQVRLLTVHSCIRKTVLTVLTIYGPNYRTREALFFIIYKKMAENDKRYNPTYSFHICSDLIVT